MSPAVPHPSVGVAPASESASKLSLVAFALGALGLIAFLVGGEAISGVFWFVGAAIGAIAVGVGVTARRRREPGRGLALGGIALGAIAAVWFVAFIVVDALDVSGPAR